MMHFPRICIHTTSILFPPPSLLPSTRGCWNYAGISAGLEQSKGVLSLYEWSTSPPLRPPADNLYLTHVVRVLLVVSVLLIPLPLLFTLPIPPSLNTHRTGLWSVSGECDVTPVPFSKKCPLSHPGVNHPPICCCESCKWCSGVGLCNRSGQLGADYSPSHHHGWAIFEF